MIARFSNLKFRGIGIMLLFVACAFVSFSQLDATFSSPDADKCPGNLFTINANTTTYSSYNWTVTGPSFNQTPTGNSIALYLTNSGQYTVTLTVGNGVTTNTSTVTNFLTVYNVPVINYSLTPTSGCSPLTVAFNGSCTPGSGTLSSFSVNSGSGTNYTTEDFSHVYNVADTFTPNATVTNSFGCITTGNLTDIIVRQTPSLTSPTNPNSVCSGSVFNYTPTATPTGCTFGWTRAAVSGISQVASSGTGNISETLTNTTGSNINVVYVFTITAPNGCVRTQNVTVSVRALPTVTISPATVSICSGQTTTLTATGSGTGGTYTWSPGGATTSTRTVTTAGTYSVVYSDGTCASSSVSRIVGSATQPTVTLSVAETSITANDGIICSGSSVVITANPSIAGGTYLWGGGTAQNATTSSVTVSPTTTTAYTLTYTNVCASSPASATITVRAVPIPAYTSSNSNVCSAPATTTYTSVATAGQGTITSTSWSFPGGSPNTSNIATPLPVTYNVGGTSYSISQTITNSVGCSATTTFPNAMVIGNGTPPTSSFTNLKPLIQCVDIDSAKFVYTGTGADTIRVDWGDGLIELKDNLGSFSRKYALCGTYTVTLTPYKTIGTSLGCAGAPTTYTMQIKGPQAKITASAINCSNQGDRTFTAGSCGTPTMTLQWDITNAFTSPPYSFSSTSSTFSLSSLAINANPYKVKLTATDATTGCATSIDNLDYYVFPNNLANFKASTGTLTSSPEVTEVCIDGCLNLINTTPAPQYNNGNSSTSIFTRWEFNTNDGLTWSTNAAFRGTPKTCFPLPTIPGSYGIAMINRDANGCNDTIIKNDYIKVYGITGTFTVADTNICANTTITFNSSGITTPSFSSIVSRVWSWGDGTPNTTNVVSPTHTFTTTGPRTVTLTVTDAFGCVRVITRNILVRKPFASFSVDRNYVCNNQTVTVTDASTGNSALTYAWLTTGATPVTSTLQNPGAFTFNTIGNGSIKLTVTETGGCSDDTTIAITVNNPFPNSTATPNFVSCFNPPTVVNFTNTSVNNVDITSAQWNFGNGQTSNNWNPSTTYNLPGTYIVSLTVSSLTGCSVTRNVDTVTIGGPFGTIGVTSALTGCSCYTATITVTTSAVTEARLLYGDGQFLVLTPNTTQTVNYSYCNNGSTTITRTPSLYISNGTCNGFITAAQTINIKPTPTVNVIPNQVKCAGTSSDAVVFGGNITGATYTWSNNNTTIGLAASGSGDIPSFVTSNTTLSGIVSTITVTPSYDGCIGTPRTFTITVGPRPVVSISSGSVCVGGTVTVTPATAANGSWSSSNTSVAQITTAGAVTIQPGAGGNVVFTYTETVSGCTNSVNLTVNPRPTVTAGSQVCSGSNITLSPTTGGTWASNPGTGTATVVPTTGVVTGGNPGTVTFTFTNSTTTCTNTTTAVTVNALPTVTVTSATVCQGTGATATPTPNATGTWVSSNTAVAQITNSGVVTTPTVVASQSTATLTYTRTSTGCSASTTITVNPIPVLTAPSSVCIGTPGALTPTTGGTWTSSNTNVATVTNAGVITGVAAGSVTFTFTETATGCTATTASVAINATPVISNMTTIVCSGTAFSVTPVNGTNGTVPTGTTYTWSAPTATGITGTAAGTAASLISGTLTNTTSSTQTVAYTVTPTLGSCSGTPFTVTVTVNPRPTIAAKTATICSGGTFTVTPSNTLPDIVPTGTTYTWTVTLNGNVNGESAQATGQTNISQTLTGNASVQTVNYTVTPTSPSGTCAGSTFPLTVTVNPIPTFSATSANPASCGATNGSITLSGLTANTSYQLTYVLLGVTTGPTQRTSTGTGTIVISNLVAGSYTVSVALTSTGCQSTTQVVTLINPGAPDINDIADQVLCGGCFALPTITGTNLPGNQAYYSSPNGVGPLTGPICTSQTVYIYGISSGGCSDQESFTVTINTPASIAAKTATICSGGTFTVTPTNTLPDVVPTGTTYSWAAPSVTGVTGTAAGTAQTSISGTLVNSLNTPRTVVYSVTPTSGTCPGAAFNVTVTLNPVPAISDMTANACSTSAFTATPTNGTNGIVPSGTTYTWAAPTPAITGGSAQAVGQTSISQTLTNSTTTSTTATYTVTPTSGTCVGSTFQLVVTVNPRPIVTNRTATICSGATFTVTPTTGGGNTIPTGTTYSWSAPSVVGISGTAAGTNQTSISGTPSNTTNAAINVVYVVTPTSGSCSGTPFNVTVTVNPTPTITTINSTACSGSPFTVTPANTTNGIVPSNTTYAWAAPTFSGTGAAAGTAQNNINGTLTQSTSSPINVTYTVTPTSGTCVGTAFSVTVAVNPNPAITNMTTTVCSGTAFTVTPTNITNGTVPTGTTYSWVAPSVTGVTGTAAGTNATNISGTLINTTTTSKTIVYNVTPTLGSCSGSPFTVTVNLDPAPIIAAKTETICSAGSFTVSPTDGTGGDVVPAGTTYTWVAPSVSGITGTASGIGATDITGTLTNTSNAPIDVAYTVTPTVGSCSGTPFTVTVTVNPRPVINAMTSTTCSATSFNASPVNGTNGIVPTGTTYTWTVVLTASVFGESSQATPQPTISQNLSVTSATQTANYTVTPTFGTCVGSTFPLTVTINPRPTVTNKTAIVCSGGTFTVAPTSGSGNTIPIGTTYSWSAPSVVGITGTAAGTNATNISGTLTNLTNAAINVVYVVTPNTGSCTNSTFNVTVTVNPAATINPITTSACSGNSFTVTPANTTNGVIPNLTTYTWTAPVVAGISGTVSGAALSNISGTLLNSTSSPIPVVYTVTPLSGTCTGSDFTLTVTVNPNPVINNLSATTCSGTAFSVTPIDVTDGLIPSGTTYSWSAPTATGITGTAAGTGATSISGSLTNTSSSAQTVVYTVTPTLGSCSGTPFNVTVTVNPRPTIASKTATICSGGTFTVSPSNTLPDIVPTGTTYTWTVTPNTPVNGESAQASPQTNISQTLTSASLQTVNYTITPTSGTCIGSTFPLAVTVNPLPNLTVAKTDPTTCGATNGTITLSGLTPSTSYVVSYTLSGPPVSATLSSNGSGLITLSNLGAGTYDPITVTLVSNGCQSASQSISLNNPGAPNINDIADQVLCGGSYTLPTITGTNLPGNQAYYSSPGGVGPPLTGSISTSQTVYIYGISSGGCSDQESFTVTINTPASIAAKTATICSGGTFTVTPTNTLPDVVPTGTTYSWAAPSVTGVTGTAAGTAQTSISGTLVNSLNTPRTVVYSVTPTSGTCPGAAFNVTVTLNPVPAISDMTANACSTSAFTATPTNGTNGIVPSGTTYTWAAPTPAITGGSAQAVGQTSISQTLTNSTTTSTTATYTVTPTSGTCVGSTFQLVVTVNPRPIVINSTETICSGGTFTVTPTVGGGNTIPTGTTYSWSAPSVVGISGTAAGTNQASISGTPSNTTNAPINVVYIVTPTSGSCSGTPFNVTVTVNPTPTITTINATACSGSSFSVTPANTTNGIVPTGTTYSWAAPSVLDISGAAAGTSQNNITGTLTQSTSSPINVTYTVTPTSGTCVGTAFSVTVAVNPNPVVNNMTTSVCGGVAFSVTPVNGTNGNVPTGTTYTWSAPVAPTGISGVTSGSNSSNIIGTLVNTTNAAINVVYTVTPSLGSCSGTPFTLTVTVGPAPVIAAKTTTICSNGTFTVTPTDGSGSDVVPVGTTYSWAAPSVSGITGTTSGTASADINGTLTNTTNSGINVVYVVTPSFGSCSGMPFNVTVTVNPRPAITDMTANACIGSAFSSTPANGTNGIVPTGTTYTWATPTPAITGGSAQAIGQSAISQTLTHTSATAVTASYTVTPTSGICAGTPFILVVTVSPRPVISNESTTICSTGTFAVTPASGGSNVIPVGTTYSWVAPSVTGITGTAAGTNALVIGGSLTNTTNAPINVTYTVTPAVGGCTGATFNVTVTVDPTPALTPMLEAICTDNSFSLTPVNTTNGIVPAGTTYSWAAPTPPTGITGTASGSNLPSVSGTLTNNTNAAINVVYTVTPTSGTCLGSDFPLTVTVNPIPAITPMTATASTGVAFSVSPQTTTNGVVPGGTTYTWATPPTPPGIIGTAPGSSQPTISGNLTNTTNSGIDVVYTVTPVIGNCTGAPFSLTVTVLPRPTITAKTVIICSGETFSVCPVNGVNGDIVPLGTTYTWTVTNNVNVLGESNQTSPQSCISQTLTNGSTSTPQIVVYTVTPTSGPLVGNTFTLTVTVNPVPTFTTTKTDPTACNGTDGTVTLVNLTPNTTFNYTIIGGSLPFTVSPPVSSNASGQIVIPNLGAGNYTITVINSTNCESTPRTVTLNNPGAPNVNDIADVLVCGTSYTLPTISGTNLPTAGNGTIGFFSFPNGVGSLTGTITSPVASTQTVYIYAATPGGCSDEESFVLTINPIPVVNVATATVCVNQTITLTATSSGAPTVGTWSSLNPTFASVNPITGVITGHIAGTASIIMTETGTNCASSATLVTIKALPTVSAGPNQTICSNSSATLAGVLGGSATAGVWSGGSGPFVPSNTASNAVYTPTSLEILADSVILIYSTVDVTCSSVSDSVIIYIQDLPTVNAGANQTICSSSTALLGGTIGGSASSVTWTSSGAPGTLTSANTLTPTYTPVLADVVPTGITLTMTSNDPIGPCPAVTSTVLITVNPAATVNAGADFPACSKYAIPLAGLIGGSATSATWSGAGSFSPSNSAVCQYTPTAAELSNPFLDLTLTTNDPIGPCPAVTDVVRVTFAAPAIANAGPDQTICSGLPVNVVGTVSGTASSGVWKNANTWGSPIPVGLNITYNPSTTEVNNNLAVLFVETNDPPGPCPIERDTVLININPTPFLLGNNQFGSCTNNALNIPLTVGGGLTPITTFQWSATDNPNVSGESLGTFSSDTIPDVLINTNPLLVNENVIYNVTPTIGTCVGTPVILTVTVLPRPTMQPVADQIVCANTLTSAVNFVANIPTTSFNWTNTLPSIKNPPLNPSNGNIPSFTAINNTGDTLEATICVTPSTNLASPATTCPGTTECFKISVKPISTVNDPVDQVICAGQSTAPVVFTGSDANTIYNWTSVTLPNNNIGLAPIGQGNINSFVGVNNGTVPVVATITVTPDLNGCLGIPQTFTITVKPLPVMQTISDRTVCVGNVSNTIPFVAVPSGTTYVWTATNHAITGIPSATNTTNSFPSFTAVNVTDTVIPSLVHVVPTFNGCAGTPVDFTIFVNPILKADSIENFVFCEGETFPTRCITGNAPGVIYTWSNTNVSIGMPALGSTCISGFTTQAGNLFETATIFITPNLSGCQGIITNFTITVKPKPNVYISQYSQGHCHGVPTIPVHFTGDVAGTTFTWITQNTGIQNSSIYDNVYTSFGDLQSFTTYNQSTPYISLIGEYDVVGTANGCVSDTGEFTITVDPTPTVNHVADQTVCAGQPTVPVTFTGNLPNGTVYNWDATAQAIYPTTWTIPGTGSIPSFVPPTNDLPYTVTSKVTVTPVFGFCTGAKDSLFFNIKPKPRVNQIPNQALCVGATTQAVNFSGNMDLPLSEGPADYVWSNDNSTIGLADDGVNNIAPFIALNPGNIVITSTIDVTPHFNGCTGDTMSFTITTVAPIPIANPVPDQILCAGETTDLITFVNPNVSSYPQTSFIWSNDNPIGIASSDTADASNSFEIPPFPTVGGFTPIVSTFDVIPYYAGCAGDTMSFSITVKPVPNVFVSPQTQQACAGLPTQTVVFTGNVAGTSYDWTSNAAFTGSGSGGNGNVQSFTAVNNTTNIITNMIICTPSLNQCVGDPDTAYIYVNPTTTVVLQQHNYSYCHGDSIPQICFVGNNSATEYHWFNPNIANGLPSSGIGCIPADTAENTDLFNYNDSIIVQPQLNGCLGTPDTISIVVKPIPTLFPTPDQNLCASNTISQICFTGNMTNTTTFNWSGNNSSIGLSPISGINCIPSFVTVNSSQSIQASDFEVIPQRQGCFGIADTFRIVVNPIAEATVGDITVCNGETVPATTIFGTSPIADYIWNHNFPLNLTLPITDTTAGTPDVIPSFVAINTSPSTPIVVPISVTPLVNGCPGVIETFNLTINPTPSVDPVSSQTWCHNELTNPIVFTGPVANTTFNWANSNGAIGIAGPGVNTLPAFTTTNTDAILAPRTGTISVIPQANSCIGDTVFFTISVNPLPIINAGLDTTLCLGQFVVPQVTWQSLGGALTPVWSANPSTSVTPVNGTPYYPNASTWLTVLGTDGNLCQNRDSLFVTYLNVPPPIVNAGIDTALCFGESIALCATGNASVYVWDNGVFDCQIFTPIATDSFIVTGSSVATGCYTKDTIVVTVNPLPTVIANASVNPVCLGDATILYGTGADTYVWDNNVIDSVGFVPDTTDLYTVIGTDVNGCRDTADIVVTVNPKPNVLFSSDMTFGGCLEFMPTFTDLTSPPSAQVTWLFGNNTAPSNTLGSVTASYTNYGCYDVTLISTTAEGCIDSLTQQDFVCVNPIVADFEPDVFEQPISNPEFEFTNTSQNATSYEWFFGDGTGTDFVHPEHIYDSVGFYTVVLVASAQDGCTDTARITIKVRDEVIIWVPNTFTPDDNGLNDLFSPVLTAGYDRDGVYEFKIYNRWGEQIFFTDQYGVQWDGTYNGEKVQMGSYNWSLRFKDSQSNKIYDYYGHVNVLR